MPSSPPGLVIVVDNEVPVPMLTASGQPSGQQYNPPKTGQVAFLVTLSQGPDGQFRFYETSQLNPPGGIAAPRGAEVSRVRWAAARRCLGGSHPSAWPGSGMGLGGGNGNVGGTTGQGSFGPSGVSAGGDGLTDGRGPGLAVSTSGPPDPAPSRQSGYTWKAVGSMRH